MKKILASFLCILIALTMGCNQNKNNNYNGTNNHDNSSQNTLPVDNNTNNLVANEYNVATAIDDKLYFLEYSEDSANLYEISSGKPTKVYSEKLYDYSGSMIYNPYEQNLLSLNYILDNKILRYANIDTYIDTDNGKLIDIPNTYMPDSEFEYETYIFDNYRYFFGNDKVYRYQDGEYKLLFSGEGDENNIYSLHRESTYIHDDDFYVKMLSEDGNYILRYSFDEQKELSRVKIQSQNGSVLSSSGFHNMIADDNDVYYSINSTIYHADLRTGKIEELYKKENSLVFFNYYDKTLYVTVNDLNADTEKGGLYSIDTQNHNEVTELISGSIGGAYIFDNLSVYYDYFDGNGNYTLCRFCFDKREIETLF